MHARARGSFSQLSVVPSESTIGFVYRVVDGPVYSRAEADDRLQRARFAGFLDAWLFIKDESFVMPQGLSETELAAGAPINPDPLLADDQYGYGLSGSTSDAGLDSYSNEYRSDYDNQGAINATEEYSTTPSVGEQTLVETAPPGYGLHQLRRAGPTTGAGERGSRLRALGLSSGLRTAGWLLQQSCSRYFNSARIPKKLGRYTSDRPSRLCVIMPARSSTDKCAESVFCRTASSSAIRPAARPSAPSATNS